MNYIDHLRNLRNLRIVVGLFVLFGVGGTISLFIYHRSLTPEKITERISDSQRPSTRLEIRGVKYDGSFDGKRVLSIIADKFTVEKKKLGFLRFGLMNVAKLENALIQIYGQEMTSETKLDGRPENPQKNLSFKGVFSKKTLPSFPVKNISSIVLEPVSVELYNDKSVVTSISANTADLSLTRRVVLFKGNVRVVSGDRVLTADQINLFAEQGIIKTEGHFLLKTRSDERKGYQLTTDIFLNPITL